MARKRKQAPSQNDHESEDVPKPEEKDNKRARKGASPGRDNETVLRDVATPSKVHGAVYVLGSGDCGQLGLGEDVSEKLRPGIVSLPNDEKVIEATAGGMHTLCIGSSGTLYSWGVNDEAALGRFAGGEPWNKSKLGKGKPQDSYTPGIVKLPKECGALSKVSAGDSHSVVLTAKGAVLAWGTYRDDAGVMGFSTEDRFALLPTVVWAPRTVHQQVLEISSGCDHVAARCANGDILTWGSGKQGQLGRIGPRRSNRAHDQLASFTVPAPMHLPLNLRSKPCSISCGWYSTYVLLADGTVYSCGLNNYQQLGYTSQNSSYAPKKMTALKDYTIASVAGGSHHVVLLTTDGKVLTLGRPTYGRLGRTDVNVNSDEAVSTIGQADVQELDGTVIGIGAGGEATACFTDKMCGMYMCGSNNTGMLGKGDDDEDSLQLTKVKRTKVFNEVVVKQVFFGGQHVVIMTVPHTSG